MFTRGYIIWKWGKKRTQLVGGILTPFFFPFVLLHHLVLGWFACKGQPAFSLCLRGSLVEPRCLPGSFAPGMVQILQVG